MERMQLQGTIVSSLWADQQAASTSAAAAAQMPFLALLQGAAVVDTDDRNGGERKRAAAFAACADFDLLESCVMQAAANVTVAPAASTSAAAAAQMPFLALLQGAAVVDTDDRNGGERKRAAAFAACADFDLLESCVTQAAANVTVAPAASRVESRRRKRPRLRPRAAPQQEKRKRPEEAESQRMTHIAVERNRRRLMNDHLASLRALIPTSYIPRGDQATVVGGAIDYVKQLEQQLVALQASAAARRVCLGGGGASAALSDGVFVSPQYRSYSESSSRGGCAAGVDVEATGAVGGHVRVRVAGRRWPGRLVRAVAALEDLRLAVLHLAVTSVGRDAVVYCFNLKMEDGCEVATADEVATVVHQIFFAYAGTCC